MATHRHARLAAAATFLAAATLLGPAAAHAAPAPAPAPASPPVYLAGVSGIVPTSVKTCLQRSKAGFKARGLKLFFARYYPVPGGEPQSVAFGIESPPGKTYAFTQVSVKCVGGAPYGQSFFSVDAASTAGGVVDDLAGKVTDVLFGQAAAADGRRARGQAVKR